MVSLQSTCMGFSLICHVKIGHKCKRSASCLLAHLPLPSPAHTRCAKHTHTHIHTVMACLLCFRSPPLGVDLHSPWQPQLGLIIVAVLKTSDHTQFLPEHLLFTISAWLLTLFAFANICAHLVLCLQLNSRTKPTTCYS